MKMSTALKGFVACAYLPSTGNSARIQCQIASSLYCCAIYREQVFVVFSATAAVTQKFLFEVDVRDNAPSSGPMHS